MKLKSNVRPHQSSARRIARIARKRTIRLFQSRVDLKGIPRGLGRTLDQTLDLMPLDGRLLTQFGAQRSKYLNRQLAWSLAFVAGAVNAGGFLAVHSYTSHVTGAVSRMADELALGHKALAFEAMGIVVCFLVGALCSSLLISLGRRHRFKSRYALTLMIEAGLLILFGLLGGRLEDVERFSMPVTIILLSFIMGMHNSVVTNISNAEVRTTHMTGIVTDLGLELGRVLYINRRSSKKVKRIEANWDKLKLHGLILFAFFGGALSGALGFKHVGFKVTLFLAAFLIFLAFRPILYDVRVRYRLLKQPME